MKLNDKTLRLRIARARAATGKGTTYKLGAGDLGDVEGFCDCTGFISHCCYLHRNPKASSGKRKGWVESTAIYKDATGKQETWVKLDDFVPGCVIVYPDAGGREGHAAICSQVARLGGQLSLKGIDCGSPGITHRNLTWMLERNPIAVTLRQDVLDMPDPKPTPAPKPAELLDAVVDLSHHNELTDSGFNEMKRAGILAVIHKATQGTLYTDPEYAERKKRAESIGLLFGAYHFGNGSDPVKQAEHFLENSGDAKWLCLDWEDLSMSLAQAEAFVTHVHAETGVWPVLYSGQAFIIQRRKGSQILDNCPLWIARYNSQPPIKAVGAWTLWQYSSTGRVPGIVGNVDRNRFAGTADELRAWWKDQEAA